MSGSAPGTITVLIAQLKSANGSDAATELWHQVFRRLASFAQSKMEKLPRRLSDHEQAAVDAFYSLLRGVEENRFPDLQDRDDLWQVLFDLAEKKSVTQLRYHSRLKRNWRRSNVKSTVDSRISDSNAEQATPLLKGTELTPEFIAQCAEEFQSRLAQLDAEDYEGNLRHIATAKLQGFSNAEIAMQCEVAIRTIERRLRRIREIWIDAE